MPTAERIPTASDRLHRGLEDELEVREYRQREAEAAAIKINPWGYF